jgi:hypothetical protein
MQDFLLRRVQVLQSLARSGSVPVSYVWSATEASLRWISERLSKTFVRNITGSERLVLLVAALTTVTCGTTEHFVDETKTPCVQMNCFEGQQLLASVRWFNAVGCNETS